MPGPPPSGALVHLASPLKLFQHVQSADDAEVTGGVGMTGMHDPGDTRVGELSVDMDRLVGRGLRSVGEGVVQGARRSCKGGFKSQGF